MTERQRYFLYGMTLLLLLPALLVNLGVMTLINDEAIRGLVALEMQISGNYIAPTLNGEFYYNKPPLYNWIILASFWLTNEISEFSLRLPTIFFLLAYAATIFYYVQQHFSEKVAWINAFVFITCGRILFWDSQLGLIDICFSWVMFLLFMTVFHRFKKQQFWQLFLITYSLTAVGFMLKGLPAIVFQAITILTYFIYKKEWKRLFTAPNFVGLGVFLLIISSYYLVYHQYNSLENVFTTLFTESSKRTVVNYGIGDTVLHFFSFPFEMVYHFLPWSLFVIYFIKKGIHKVILQNEFITYCLLIFLTNIFIYWTSPEVYPRYLLMLAPLFFCVLIYLHELNRVEKNWQFRVIQGSFVLLAILILFASGATFFLKRLEIIDHRYWKASAILLLLTPILYAFWKFKNERILVTFVLLLIARLSFNWFVIPDRNANDWGDIVRQSSVEAGNYAKGKPLYIYKKERLEETNTFYITRIRKDILPYKYSDFVETDLYVFNPRKKKVNPKYEKVVDMKMREQHFRMAVGILE